MQRITALKAARAYNTVSTEAALVISQILPVDLFLQEEVAKRDLFLGRPVQDREGMGLEGREVETKAAAEGREHPAEAARFQFEIGEAERGEDRVRIRIYTDGSRLEDGRAGAAFVAYNEEEEITNAKYRLGEGSSIFQCELFAIRGALVYIREHEFAFPECVVCTDSRSALAALRGMRNPTSLQLEVWRLYEDVTSRVRVKFVWVKSHTGIVGNERADELAKEAAISEEAETAYDVVPRALVKRRVRERSRRRWNERWREAATGRLTARLIPDLETRAKIGCLDRHAVQLITGHGGFRSYLVRIGKLPAGGEACECGEPDTAEHVLFGCALEEQHRGVADRRLTEKGLRWPRDLEEASRMCSESEWWAELKNFAKKVDRLRIVRG